MHYALLHCYELPEGVIGWQLTEIYSYYQWKKYSGKIVSMRDARIKVTIYGFDEYTDLTPEQIVATYIRDKKNGNIKHYRLD